MSIALLATKETERDNCSEQCINDTLPLIVTTVSNAAKNPHTIQPVRPGIQVSGPPETSRCVNATAL